MKRNKEKVVTPKQFIKNTLINEMRDIVHRHPYLSFALLAAGIEFLGKCMLIEFKEWDLNKEKSKKAFSEGEKLLINIDNRYGELGLKDQLRNGFLHTLKPKSNISLSEVKAGDVHFNKDSKGRTILVIEIFYRDFVMACKRVINQKFQPTDKMNKPFIKIYDL
mgnify:CR=1 FL=1